MITNRKYLFRSIRLISKKFMSGSVAKEQKITVGDYNINYIRVGEGPHHVLCLPGALGTIWTDFKPQIEGFDKNKFTLVAWDPPGYGKSRPPNKIFSPDFYDKDADIAYQFMKTLKILNYSLMGWSDGGVASIILAAKYPHAVNKLVIWGANAFILPHELKAYQKTKDINTWSQKMKQERIDLYGEKLFAEYWKNWVEGMANMFIVKEGNICAEKLKHINCATLILHGMKDPLVDNVHVSHLHTHIQNSRIHLYPEGKHNIHLRYAEEFNKTVQDFLLAPSNSN